MIKISSMNKVDNGKIKAFFTVDLKDKLVIRDCKLIDGDKGLFVAMPSRQYDAKDGTKKWTNIVQVLDIVLMEKIQAAAIKEYGYVPEDKPEQQDDFPF